MIQDAGNREPRTGGSLLDVNEHVGRREGKIDRTAAFENVSLSGAPRETPRRVVCLT